MPVYKGEHDRIYQKPGGLGSAGSASAVERVDKARLTERCAKHTIETQYECLSLFSLIPTGGAGSGYANRSMSAVVVLSLLIVFFAVTVVRKTNIPTVLLADQKRNYRALKLNEPKKPPRKGTHRKTLTPASQVVLNSGEGIRGAFYVTWDAASFSSLREYIHQIDFVFPEWLHVLGADGHLQAVNENNTLYDVIDNGHAADIDPKLMPMIKSTNAQVDVLPMVNNFDPIVNEWRGDVAKMLDSKDAREHFRQELEHLPGQRQLQRFDA